MILLLTRSKEYFDDYLLFSRPVIETPLGDWQELYTCLIRQINMIYNERRIYYMSLCLAFIRRF